MFRVNQIQVIEEDQSNHLKVTYTFLGPEPKNIRVRAKDIIFDTTYYFSNNQVNPNGSYWTLIIPQGKHCNTYFTMGIVLEFWDAHSDEILFSKRIPFIKTSLKSREFDRPNFWVIGDSNVGFYFSNKKDVDLDQGNWTLNYCSHLALSLNRFLNSDSKRFLLTLPIMDGDVISFCLGEIDLRVALMKRAAKKSCSPEHLLSKILHRYVDFIQEMKSTYPECKIAVIMPNPPLRDGIISDSHLIRGNEKERLELWYQFYGYLKAEEDLKNIDYFFRVMDDYTDEAGFLREDMLEDTHHVNDGTFFLNSLIQQIRDKNLFDSAPNHQ